LEARALPSFRAPILYAAGGGPVGVAVADFNGDGKPDFVVTNSHDNTVSVFLNDGEGGFRPGVAYPAGPGPNSVAVGDFNGDGKPDIAVADANGTGVSVLFNKGDGTFAPPVTFNVGASPNAIAAGDLNGDGKIDLVTANFEASTVSVLLNTGGGTFAPAASYAVGALPNGIAIGDFTGSGKPCLVTANYGANGISILPNKGDGTYSPAVTAAAGANPNAVAVGSFHAAGILDVAVANFGDGTVTIQLNDGHGNFHPAGNFAAGSDPAAVATGDFNGDGKLDLVVTNQLANEVSILYGNGDGTFQMPVSVAGGSRPVGVAVADFDGDGKPDVVAADNQGDSAAVLLAQTPAVPLVATGPDQGGGPEVKVYDVATGARRLDFFAYDPAFRGGVRVAVADVTGDGVPDIITAPGPGGGPDIRVFDGVSGQLVREFMAYDAGFSGGVNIAAADINGDGIADIVTGADQGGGPHVKAFDGQALAAGKVTALASFFAYDPAFAGGVRVAVADVTGDHKPDIITTPGPGGGPDVRVFDGASLASAGPASDIAREFFAYDAQFTMGVYVAAGDTNADGAADIVTGAGAGGGPHVKVFSGKDGSVLASFMAYQPNFVGGARVAVLNVLPGDVVVGPGPGGGPDVRLFDLSAAQVDEFFTYDAQFTGGIFVGAV
jgi:hypothetical protein